MSSPAYWWSLTLNCMFVCWKINFHLCVLWCVHAVKAKEEEEAIFNFYYRSLDLWTACNGVAEQSTKQIMCFVQNLKKKQNFFKSVADTKPFHPIDNNLFSTKYVGKKPFSTLQKKQTTSNNISCAEWWTLHPNLMFGSLWISLPLLSGLWWIFQESLAIQKFIGIMSKKRRLTSSAHFMWIWCLPVFFCEVTIYNKNYANVRIMWL